ncbi:MAG: hypothetical protein KKB20_21055 [Proteobacteria bacterium]|nr:hypothetical protein [Pseudomonadota bacterium]
MRGRAKRLIALGLALACLVVPGRALAEDIDVTISSGALERLFKAAAPYVYQYELWPGQPAVELVLSNPRLELEPGRPGRIHLKLDYTASSKMLGIKPSSGQTRPEVLLKYDQARQALRLTLDRFVVKLGPKLSIPLDRIIQPAYIPLAPAEPVRLERHLLVTEVAGCKTAVTSAGIRVLIDYRFFRRPRP